MELILDKALRKGIEAHNAGHVQEALPFFKTALDTKPSVARFWLSYIDTLIKLGQMADAKAVFDQAKEKGAKGEDFDQLEKQFSEPSADPQDPPPDQLQAIISLFTQGQMQQALSDASQMLDRFPNSAVLYNIAGACNAGLMQFDAAIDKYKQSLKIKPDYAKAYNNLAIALNHKGDPEAAVESCKQALEIEPDYADAYNNMGIALNDDGNSEAAVDSYNQALKINPHDAEVHNNMGVALSDKGDLDAAIDSYKKALKINPDYAEAYYNMGLALPWVEFTEPNSDFQELITSLLDRENDARPIDISTAAISLLKLDPVIKEIFEQHFLGQITQSLERVVSNLSKAPLLFKLMSVCPLADLELEVVLTDVRSSLLLSVSEISNAPEVLRFQSALALQCFTNEYIYNQSNQETKALRTLETVVQETLLKGEQPSLQAILCLAAYKALHGYEWLDLLTVTSDIEEVFTRQVLEPKLESRLKSDMPALQDFTDKVSLNVREQYECNPYPRWVNLQLSFSPFPISRVTKEVKLKLFDKAIMDVKTPNILIAGCGTGQHSIGTASRFKNAKVLAVDLSLSSLAYAKRKTEELGFRNIDYLQADILDLGKLDRKFDIIESAGVLHHMDDPMSGWIVLTDCLELGGLMKIGLYSELARQDIVRIREEINQSGIDSSDIAMKIFRGDVINSSEEHHNQIVSSNNFYSLSELRDLLFHVQEHRFTIPQIQKCLDELGLKFCGFEADKIVRHFKLTNVGTDDPYDLDKWNSYEVANPNAFVGMYQFWCQKVA